MLNSRVNSTSKQDYSLQVKMLNNSSSHPEGNKRVEKVYAVTLVDKQGIDLHINLHLSEVGIRGQNGHKTNTKSTLNKAGQNVQL